MHVFAPFVFFCSLTLSFTLSHSLSLTLSPSNPLAIVVGKRMGGVGGKLKRRWGGRRTHGFVDDASGARSLANWLFPPPFLCLVSSVLSVCLSADDGGARGLTFQARDNPQSARTTGDIWSRNKKGFGAAARETRAAERMRAYLHTYIHT